MRKVILILGIITSTLFAETIFDVVKTNNEVITGYLVEDNPGESIVIETLEGKIIVIAYDEFLLIRPHSKVEEVETIEEGIKEEEIPPEVTEPLEPKEKVKEEVKIPSYNIDDLSYKLQFQTIFALNDIVLDPELLENTTLEVRNKVYQESKKEEVLNYTLFNLIPGLGSILQGDYYSAAYTIGSILGAVAYNMGDGFGTDYYFVINLNGLIAYTASFFAPYRFNNTYNSLLKEKLDIE